MAAILRTALAIVLLAADAWTTEGIILGVNQTFRWREDPWSSCIAPGGCGDGHRKRRVICEGQDGPAAYELCYPPEPPPHSKPCFTACRHHADRLQWQPGEWGPCLPVAPEGMPPMTQVKGKLMGVKQRNVSCVLVAHDFTKVYRVVDEDNCFTVSRKPDPVRFCYLPSPSDCVVSQFSEWSACEECGEGDNQTRVRTVLVAPVHGGKTCPQLTETRPCRPSTECLKKSMDRLKTTPEYKLKVGEWRRCEAPTSIVSADAFESHVIAQAGSRVRGHGRFEVSIESFPRLKDLDDEHLTFQPQVGYQTREVSCRDSRGTSVDISLCLSQRPGAPLLSRTRPCVVPQDCVVSEWTPLFVLQQGCVASTGKVLPELHERKRRVVALPQGEGQPCPHLVESRRITEKEYLQPCEERFRWLGTKWSPCVVTSDEPGGSRLQVVGCGGGVQLRDVTCVSIKNDKPVPQEMCEPLEPLPTVQRCEVACPRDCEVGPWGAWDACKPVDCSDYSHSPPQGFRERRRSILVMSSEEGVDCPSTKEVQPCPQPTCYSWAQGHWTSCYLDPGFKHCGEGRRTRAVTCRSTLYGNVVDDSLCLREQVKPPTEEPCLLPCPYDCVLSPWSEWSPCSHSCSSSSQVALRQRNRTVVAPPGPGGHSCPDPDEMLQIEPCNTHSCLGYSWFTLPWQTCLTITPPALVTPAAPSMFPSKLDSDMDMSEAATTSSEEEGAVYNSCVVFPDSDMDMSEAATTSSEEEGAVYNSSVVFPDSDMDMSEAATTSSEEEGAVYNSSVVFPDSDMDKSEAATTSSEEEGAVYNSSVVFPDSDMDMSEAASASSEEEGAVYNSSTSSCGHGEQQREVWCLEGNDKKVPDWQCHPLPKPVTTRPCSGLCPVDCRMSPWSFWSRCPQQCLPDDSDEVRDSEGKALQTRHRVVIQWPANGGEECGSLKEVIACPMSANRCYNYTWAVDEWSGCQLPTTVECGVGFRTRAVWCYRHERSNKVEPSLCIEANGSIPEQSQPCYVICGHHCVVSQWSKWSACDHACSYRTRTRELIGISASRTICRNPDLFPLVESEPCPCGQYVLRSVWEWSDCILENDIASVSANGRAARGICGSGTRYKRFGCYDKNGTLVDPRLCSRHRGIEEEPCLVACPVDCQLGEWTSWGECSSLCGPGMQNRTRELIQEPANSGRPCEDMVQHKVCNEPCANFQWFTGGWSECQLIGADQNRGCGTGDQFRHVRCMQLRLHELPLEVEDKYCDPITQPPDINACHVACPGECVLGPWSDWSECPQPCDRGVERQRTRSVLRAPASTAATCPPQIEVQSCHLNHTCFTYSWRWTEYSSCLPLGGSPCGEGVQSRIFFCQRSDGRPVLDSMCEDQTRPALTEKWCYVDCPVDCEVTQWTLWNNSECQCGNTGSTRMRFRYIVTNPSEKGRPCPLPLVQRKPCPALPCYSWSRGEWSSCDLHGAWCGHGTIFRNLTCVRGSEQVEDRFCEPSTIDMKTSDSCYVPCNGDCQVSEWSHWSHCHWKCKAEDLSGYQTRSRAVLKPPVEGGDPCPTALWETRPCFVDNCLSFDWIHTEDGQITCQRSDGVLVVGGCDGKPKPCPASCRQVQNSMCDPQSGMCGCAPGNVPLRRDTRGHATFCKVALDVDANVRRRAGEQAGATEHSASPDQFQSRYYYYHPKDDISVWMFAMIGIGCVFIVFVAVSIYLMCHRSAGGRSGHHEQILAVRQSSKP